MGAYRGQRAISLPIPPSSIPSPSLPPLADGPVCPTRPDKIRRMNNQIESMLYKKTPASITRMPSHSAASQYVILRSEPHVRSWLSSGWYLRQNNHTVSQFIRHNASSHTTHSDDCSFGDDCSCDAHHGVEHRLVEESVDSVRSLEVPDDARPCAG